MDKNKCPFLPNQKNFPKNYLEFLFNKFPIQLKERNIINSQNNLKREI
jgi:hypothetical protein